MPDAAKSPICEITAPIPQTMAHPTNGFKNASDKYPRNTKPYKAPKRAAPTIPPTLPSIDLFGLNLGANLCFPIVTPTK